ncbi:hypothetical protein [Legionella drancourtii]|uniref:hypothetical protein n=1 Tax=Legionella drancourtii TaxID=168933 RepID=UPI0001B01FF9|nr:hypothetical protein [Legionella drancourtii]
MNPVIRRLQNTLFIDQSLGIDDPNPLNWTFSERIKSLAPESYRKIVSSHMLLNMEYSLLGQQIRANCSGEHSVSEQHLTEQLMAAILLAELLEYAYQHYLLVPREVLRLRAQQEIYRNLLQEMNVILPNQLPAAVKVEVGYSFSQQIRGQTINANLYRLLLTRSKRVLDLVAGLHFSADWYRDLIRNMDKQIDPFLPHLAWLYFIPRATTNLFLLLKHTLPGPWVSDKERTLDWDVRFQGQLQRRWFELGNDIVWIGVGLVNCFILAAPFTTYLVIVFFAYDVVLSALRAYIELNRLFTLRAQYQAMALAPENKEQEGQIKQHLQTLDDQITFEMLRLGSHLIITMAIFLATCCAASLFAAMPIIPMIGAVSLVLVCLINFALVPILNHYRPKDMVEVPAEGIRKLGFFAKKDEPKKKLLGTPVDSDECDDEENADDESDNVQGLGFL